MKKLLTFFGPLVLILFVCSIASAGTYDSYPDPIKEDLVGDLAYWASDDGGASVPFGGVLVGDYYVTLIGWEAGYDNVFGSDEDGTLLAKFDYPMIGDWSTVVNFSTDGAYFQSEKGETSYFNTGDVDIEMWLVTQDFDITYPGFDLMLRAGDIVAGYDDNPTQDDDNHDDLIVAFRAVPIPPPALLLGLGLIGLVGMRRRVFH